MVPDCHSVMVYDCFELSLVIAGRLKGSDYDQDEASFRLGLVFFTSSAELDLRHSCLFGQASFYWIPDTGRKAYLKSSIASAFRFGLLK